MSKSASDEHLKKFDFAIHRSFTSAAELSVRADSIPRRRGRFGSCDEARIQFIAPHSTSSNETPQPCRTLRPRSCGACLHLANLHGDSMSSCQAWYPHISSRWSLILSKALNLTLRSGFIIFSPVVFLTIPSSICIFYLVR